MAVTNIPNVQNWTVTPQNGQSGYFDLMNTWLGQSTLVIASLQSAITAQNAANSEINTLASQAENNAIIATGLANYQGKYSASTTYSKGQSTSVGTLYYTSKVDRNSHHAVTDINYWVANPINNKYDRGNILGAVSQASGVPTGAIIESGSNANGTYTKFANGTMIVNRFGIVLTGYRIETSNYLTVNYPIAFVGVKPSIALSVSRPASDEHVFNVRIGAINSTTQFSVAHDNTSQTIGVYIDYIAIGRWF